MLRKGYLEEKHKGEAQLNNTKNKIKSVIDNNLASKRETRKGIDLVRVILFEAKPTKESGRPQR